MAAVAIFHLTLLIFLISIAEGRFLRLNSSDQDHNLISDGVEKQTSTCNHQYYFLPCAENAAGYIFQILVYQGLLIFGEKQRDNGSKVLSQFLGIEKFGGIIFGILTVLPSMMLMIVSGVFSSKGNARSQVSVGVGIYAGMTVFSLTVQWGICVISGRKDLLDNSNDDNHPQEASHSNSFLAKEKLLILKDTGVEIDAETRYMGGFMLLSLIPYIIVQIVVKLGVLIQYSRPWIQQRSLDYSKYELLRRGFLQQVERLGKLINEDETLNTYSIKKLFAETDKDGDKCITKAEMKSLVRKITEAGKLEVDESVVLEALNFNDNTSISEEEFINWCKRIIDDEANQSPENSDSSLRNIINEARKNLFNLFETKKTGNDSRQMDRIKSKIMKHAEIQLLKAKSLITGDGKPNFERIRSVFKKFDLDDDESISIPELEKLLNAITFGELELEHDDIIKELFKDFDKDSNAKIDESEFLEGFEKWVNEAVQVANAPDKTRSVDLYDKIVWKQVKDYNKWDFIRSVFQVLLGIVMLTFLGGPLTVNILELSYAIRLPSFCISFVIVPLAMNAKVALTALWRASEKTKGTASLTFSEIYGGVIMNNLIGLTTLLAIVYAKDLTWDFSAEVLTILVVCGIIGILAYSCTTYRLWTCILAFVLYPISLVLFYYFQAFLRWN
ncbi:hypothetical protein BUALT_Bualt14G0055700 [Buddleja alternifolia]|uniref:EF-hand domain-containing protein n=1 Tax=Buddleja alternifolia TaxID=168488 RepID=A0AAV6WQK4_9LAMI|nr:hypothetical protein BUALT_Bualt14G0055700 [Buddleja alternifolia]